MIMRVLSSATAVCEGISVADDDTNFIEILNFKNHG